MALDQTGHPIRHRPDIAAVAIVIVHDDPLIVAKPLQLFAFPSEPRIRITHETGKHRDPRPGQHQIEKRRRTVHRYHDPVVTIFMGPAQIG